MTFVVTENCIKCTYQDCVEVCPVDCFHVGPNFIVINPMECIDCGVCEPTCPAKAILPAEDLSEDQAVFAALNAELAAEWPVITVKGPAPADADDWNGKPGKLVMLERPATPTDDSATSGA